MKLFTIILTLLLLFMPVAKADSYQFMANAVTVADWLQTREIAVNDNYTEINKILGRHPSSEAVDIYFGSFLLGVNLIGENAGKYRKKWYMMVTIIELGYVIHNKKMGISFRY